MKIIKYLPAALLSCLLLFSCATGRKLDYTNDASNTYSHNKSSELKQEERKIIYSADLSVVVEDVETTLKSIQQLAKTYGGYVSASRDHSITIQVESNRMHDALGIISQMGDVQKKSINSEDVTDEYTDYSIRLQNAQKARERYLALLAQAENVTAALQVENELERLNGTIDLLEGKMKRLDHQVAYTPITVQVNEKVKAGPLGLVFVGLYKGIKWIFVRN